MGTVRIVIQWSDVEASEKGVYDWTSLDQILAELAVAGLKPLATVFGTPALYADDVIYAPTNDSKTFDAWTDFLKAAADALRHRGGVLVGVRHGQPRHPAAADPRMGDLERAELVDVLVADARPGRLRLADQAIGEGRSTESTPTPR